MSSNHAAKRYACCLVRNVGSTPSPERMNLPRLFMLSEWFGRFCPLTSINSLIVLTGPSGSAIRKAPHRHQTTHAACPLHLPCIRLHRRTRLPRCLPRPHPLQVPSSRYLCEG